MEFIILFIIFIFFIILITSSVYIVSEQSAYIIERLGKFAGTSSAGLNFKIPFIDKIAGKLSLKVMQLDTKAETKTLDNVFVHITTSVQYYVMTDKVADAFYKLNDPSKQINAYIYDVVRAKVPKLTLDDLFSNKDEIAIAIKGELQHTMSAFGFGIVNALVTNIEPDNRVKDAMNEINSAQRMRVVASEKGEAERILKVKLAQAEAESKALQGKGIADQRKAIIQGLQESVQGFQHSVGGTSAQDVMNLVLMTQYFDTLKEVSNSSKTNTIMIPHNPAGMKDLAMQMRQAMIEANSVNNRE